MFDSEIEASTDEVKEALENLSNDPDNQDLYDEVMQAISQLERLAGQILENSELQE